MDDDYRSSTFPASATCRVAIVNISFLLANCKNMRHLRQIHAHVITSTTTTTNTFLLTRVLLFLTTSDKGSLPYAISLFRTIQNPNRFMYNTMIRAHSTTTTTTSGHRFSDRGCLVFYKKMMSTSSVRPDHITFPFLLKYCCSVRNLISGESVHAHVVKFGVGMDIFVQNGMISMYATFGSIQSALKVFTEMPKRDIVSWNSILIGSLRCGDLDLALGLFAEMKHSRNIVSWNSIMTGLVQADRPKDAMMYFYEMFDSDGGGVLPDKITISVIVCACAALGALDQGKWMHNYLKRRNELEMDTVVGTALVDMYGKCGCVERASNVFEDIPNKDVLAWTAMISAFAVNGHGEEAFALFSEMKKHGIRPNQVTFGALLSACAHSGLLVKGRQCFSTMKEVYGIVPNLQHYACMVDLLSRAGLFKEALELIRTMPMRPDVYVLGALLGGCRMHGNAELGEELAEYLINLDPRNHVFYVILSDLYAKGNKFSKVKRIREFMSENGINKTLPGCSMIEINGFVHEFSVNGYGRFEVSSNEIGVMLNLIVDELRCAKPSDADNEQITGI